MSEEQKKEKLAELRKKEQEIQDILAKKTKELKKICLREAVRNHFVLQLYRSIFSQPHIQCLELPLINRCSAAGRLIVSVVALTSSKCPEDLLFCAFRSLPANCQKNIPFLQVKDHHRSDGELALLSS